MSIGFFEYLSTICSKYYLYFFHLYWKFELETKLKKIVCLFYSSIWIKSNYNNWEDFSQKLASMQTRFETCSILGVFFPYEIKVNNCVCTFYMYCKSTYLSKSKNFLAFSRLKGIRWRYWHLWDDLPHSLFLMRLMYYLFHETKCDDWIYLFCT